RHWVLIRPGRSFDIRKAQAATGIVLGRDDRPVFVDHGFAGAALRPRTEDDLALGGVSDALAVLSQHFLSEPVRLVTSARAGEGLLGEGGRGRGRVVARPAELFEQGEEEPVARLILDQSGRPHHAPGATSGAL